MESKSTNDGATLKDAPGTPIEPQDAGKSEEGAGPTDATPPEMHSAPEPHPTRRRGEPQLAVAALEDGSTISIAKFQTLYERDLGRSSFPAVVCRSCRLRVTAVLPEKKQSHFRHETHAPECWATAPEGELHLNAKAHLHHLLEELRDAEGVLRGQAACAECGVVHVFDAARLSRRHSVVVEHWGNPEKTLKPDVAVTCGEPVAWLEVLVHSAMSEKKKRHVVARGLPTVELRAEDVLAIGSLVDSALPLAVQVHGLRLPPCPACAEAKRREAERAAEVARREAEVATALEAWVRERPYFNRDLASVVVAFFEPKFQKSVAFVRYVFEGHFGDSGLMGIELVEEEQRPRGRTGFEFGSAHGPTVTTSLAASGDIPARDAFLDWASRELENHIRSGSRKNLQYIPLGNLRAVADWPEFGAVWRREVQGSVVLGLPYAEVMQRNTRRTFPPLEPGWIAARDVLGLACARRPDWWKPSYYVDKETLATARQQAISRARDAMRATRRTHLLSPVDIQTSVLQRQAQVPMPEPRRW